MSNDSRDIRSDEAIRKAKEEKPEADGFWKSQPSDDPAGYGGGRERAEEFSKDTFGDAGWSVSRKGAESGPDAPETSGDSYQPPAGATPTQNSGPGWESEYVRENADKYGQAGGRPTAQRGSAQSGGGFEHRQQGLGSTQDVTPRGTYGQKETEHWKQQPTVSDDDKEKP